MGIFLDRGTTVRRHVRVTDIEYIGKESNKWEDQYYFGFDEEEEIRYGMRPEGAKSLPEAVDGIVAALGQRVFAKELGISRAKLSKLLKMDFRVARRNLCSEFLELLGG